MVSPERYAELERRNMVYGYLVIDIAPENANAGIGLKTSEMSAQEREEYGGKVPLADELEGFAYPINDIVVYGYEGETMLSESYELNATTDYYQPSTNMGNVYLTRPLGEVAPLTFKNPNNGHYKLVINISKVVPYEEQYAGIAVAQATQYAIMDYFDQYTFASTTAQMIAEIGYTVSITVTSTLISAPALLLGSYSSVVVNTGSKAVSTATTIAMTLLNTFGKLPILMVSEALEEVIVDSLVETFFESLVRRIGGTTALGHWVSTLMTSLRETKAFGIFTGSDTKTKTNTDTQIDVNTQLSAQQQLQSELKSLHTQLEMNEKYGGQTNQLQAQIQELQQQMNDLKSQTRNTKKIVGQLFGAGMLGGLMLFIPSFAGFSYYGLKGVFNLATKGYDHLKQKALIRNFQTDLATQIARQNLIDALKKPMIGRGEQEIIAEISEEAVVQTSPSYQISEIFHPMGKVSHFTIFGPEMGITIQSDIDNWISYENALYEVRQNEINRLKGFVSEFISQLEDQYKSMELKRINDGYSILVSLTLHETDLLSDLNAEIDEVPNSILRIIQSELFESLRDGRITDLELSMLNKLSDLGKIFSGASPTLNADYLRLFLVTLVKDLNRYGIVSTIDELNTLVLSKNFIVDFNLILDGIESGGKSKFLS
ncbi:MAG: hypothetical protein P8Y23_07250 [Candidatus Lokiarchaeota archaeon]